MSAYMCSERQLTILAAYAVVHCHDAIPYSMRASESDARTMSRVFSMLVTENLASLAARYPADTSGEATFDAYQLQRKAVTERLPALHIIKLCHHYAYQSCEHDGWKASHARKLIQAIEAHAVCNLPGYDDAPWGVS